MLSLKDKASWDLINKHYPIVDPALKVWCMITFVDDLNLHIGYGVFLDVVDLGGLERREIRGR